MAVHQLDISNMWTKSELPIGDVFLDALYNDYKDSVDVRLKYYRFLYHLVYMRNPVVALELGVESGVASAHMCSAMCKIRPRYKSRVVGVDLTSHSVPAIELKKEYGNYKFIVGNSVNPGVVIEVARVVQDYGPIGVVFQDSSHHYAESCKEWDMYSKYLASNAIWVCDDISPAFKTPDEDKGMVEYFQERPGVKQLFPYADGGNAIGVIVL